MHFPEIHILELETVDSTNLYAKDNFDVLDDCTLVSAEAQTAGKGRLGRQWFSPPGTNIYVSLVMKRISNPFYATIVSSLAVLEMLERELPRAPFYIKWPNDVYVDHRKISGILCECSTRGSSIEGVIAGIGVNINLDKKELDSIGQPAASLKFLSGVHYDVKKLSRELADSLEKYYAVYLRYPEVLFDEWKGRNYIIGRNISLSDPTGNIRNLFIRDIAETGELIAEENGVPCRFHCGDVTILKESLPGTPD